MATPTELARDALSKVDVLRSEFDFLKGQIDKLSLNEVRERIAVLEKGLEELGQLKEEVKRIAVLEDRVAELKRLKEQGEKRQWQFAYILAGGLTTLLVTLIV